MSIEVLKYSINKLGPNGRCGTWQYTFKCYTQHQSLIKAIVLKPHNNRPTTDNIQDRFEKRQVINKTEKKGRSVKYSWIS